MTGPDRRRVVVAERHHQVVSREEFVSGEYSVEVLAGYAHKLRQACSGADEYCVKSFFIEQRVNRNCPSCNDIRLYLDTERLYLADFVGEHALLRKSEFGNAVLQHSAGLVKRFEDGDLVAFLCQV